MKKGPIRQHHFAHIPPNVCTFGQGETEIHYKAKKSIFEQLSKSPNCSFCELEYKIEDFIPDIYAIIDKVHVAIEVQRSKLSIEYAINKTKFYHSKGISILWVVPDLKIIKFNSKYGENVCHASKWILFFNTLDFGRLYIWSGESDLVEMVHQRMGYFYPCLFIMDS